MLNFATEQWEYEDAEKTEREKDIRERDRVRDCIKLTTFVSRRLFHFQLLSLSNETFFFIFFFSPPAAFRVVSTCTRSRFKKFRLHFFFWSRGTL